MVKRVFLFLFFAVLLGFFLNGCTSQICSTPYILSHGQCCLDKNKDTVCDETQNLPDEDAQPFVPIVQQSDVSAVDQQAPGEEPKEAPQQIPAQVVAAVSQGEHDFLGNPAATVTVLEFGDYTDANSQRFHKEVLPELLKTYGEKIKYMYKDFPVINNKNAQLAGEASECAREQGKFWEYHDLLFANAQKINPSTVTILAETAKLNVYRFSDCLASQRYEKIVRQERKDGETLGVPYTPTFFIGNQRLVGFKHLDKFDEVFKTLLYDTYKAEQGKTITAHSIGAAYSILEGVAALGDHVPGSPYSNTLELADATFSVDAHDLTPKDSSESQDNASLLVIYNPKRVAVFYKDTYKIILKSLVTKGSDSSYGGVGIDVPLNGDSGIGTPYLPRSDVYLTLWGLADVYKNNELIGEDHLVHFMITKGIRDDQNRLLSKQDDHTIQAYLLVYGKFARQPLAKTESGFIYLFWPEINLREL